MAVDKNLFLHDLAVVAILKNEGHYLKEWLDYHLLAGVDHFYLYDNDSTDNQREVAKPYVEAGLVDYISFPGKVMQTVAYNDAVNRFKFLSRYISFIDSDEFIYPKTNRSIIEVIDEILSCDSNAGGLVVHWQCFGSNNLDKADYSRGVLERFTRRGEKNLGDYKILNNTPNAYGNFFLKLIANPRRIKEMFVHNANYFEDHYSVNENGIKIPSGQVGKPIVADKIVINHYFTKSREEFNLKRVRGRADINLKWTENYFHLYDHNEVFDDGILKYRAARAKNFSLESDAERFNRVIEALTRTLSAYASGEIFSLETALTCRALSTYLRENFPNESSRWKIYEEASLAAILKSVDGIKISDLRLLLSELPNLLALPYPIVKELIETVIQIISQTMEFLREKTPPEKVDDLSYLQRLLKAWR